MNETKELNKYIEEVDGRLTPLEVGSRVATEQILRLVRERDAVKAKVIRITLLPSQILALKTTPVTIIPAYLQSVIVVDSITAKLNFNSSDYSGANNLEFRYTDGSGAKVTADLSAAFLNSSSTAYRTVAGVITELTPVIGAPIVAAVPTADPTAGNSNLELVIRYRIVTF